MTNSELNAYLDEKCFGVDQSQKMCSLAMSDRAYDGQCTKAMRPDYYCEWYGGSTKWETCSHRKPYTPPNYCSDWAAFGRLTEWCHANGLYVSTHDYQNCYAVNIFPAEGGVINQTDKELPLALARAVYEATGGKGL